MQHLTMQNTMLTDLVKTQEKKIDELLETSKKLIVAMQLQEHAPGRQPVTVKKAQSFTFVNIA